MEKKNSMISALKKQLIAAIAMLLVATIALGSSTYAWFASNNTVTAKGMKITAQSEGVNLEISLTAGQFTDGTVTETSTEKATLYPTHIVTGEDVTAKTFDAVFAAAGNWVHTFSGSYNVFSTADFSYKADRLKIVPAVGENDVPETTEYALVVPVYLRLNPASAATITDITAKATIERANGTNAREGAAGMTTAGRVAYILKDTDLKGTEVINATGYKTGEECPLDLDITTAGDTGAKTVYVVIYFDGEDPSCTSEKFAADEYTVNVTFTGTISKHKSGNQI